MTGKLSFLQLPCFNDILLIQFLKMTVKNRSQLWRRGPNDQLIHEGSSPPQPTDALLSDDAVLSPHAMVIITVGQYYIHSSSFSTCLLI